MLRFATILVCLTLVACSSNSRYDMRHDTKPDNIRANIDFADVTPKFEPYKPANMRPYTVLGKTYYPLSTGKGYSATGVASWYGQKFHGHLTANGEVYDMFTMSAAHKTLPLPSFVRVTNLENGRQAVVRVNDRGPFHDNRIIDLSYAAALKLGVTKTGTANVKLDIMHVDRQGQLTVGNQPLIAPAVPVPDRQNKQLFIQVAALQDKTKAQRMARGLASLFQLPAVTPNDGQVYRLRLGPVQDESQATSLLEELKQRGFGGAYKVYAAP